jgi:hypothetical protein
MMTLIQIALLLTIGFTYTQKDDGVNYFRLGLMTGFSFSAGINVGSWISLGLSQVGLIVNLVVFSPLQAGVRVSLDNQLVYDAFAITTILFAIFTVAGLLASPGVLFVAISTIMVGSTVLFWSAIGSLLGLVGFLVCSFILRIFLYANF